MRKGTGERRRKGGTAADVQFSDFICFLIFMFACVLGHPARKNWKKIENSQKRCSKISIDLDQFCASRDGWGNEVRPDAPGTYWTKFTAASQNLQFWKKSQGTLFWGRPRRKNWKWNFPIFFEIYRRYGPSSIFNSSFGDHQKGRSARKSQKWPFSENRLAFQILRPPPDPSLPIRTFEEICKFPGHAFWGRSILFQFFLPGRPSRWKPTSNHNKITLA